MNREEALDEYCNQFSNMEETLNEVYDDFESRLCKNCKWYIYDTYFDSEHKDCAANNQAQSVVSFPPEDFGCNKFTRKDNE